MAVGPQVQAVTPRTTGGSITEQLEVQAVRGCITLRGELDVATVDRFSEALASAADGDHPRVVVDLQQLDFLDSSGIGVLVRAHGALREQGRSLELVVTPSGCVERTLVICGVHSLLEIRLVSA